MKETEKCTITKNKLFKLIEPQFEKYLIKNSYEKSRINAKELLTHTRFDIAFKLLYLEMLNRNVKFGHEIYKDHIRAFSLGSFTEPGNEDKNSIDKFTEEFLKTFEDIRLNGFDSSKTLIPLSSDGTIANGAHRLASAIYLEKDVEVVEINADDYIYDYKFFYSRNVPNEFLDIAATKFTEYADNVYIAFIWPRAVGDDKAIDEVIPNIVYRKEMKLTPNGAHNLFSQIYYGEEWLGNVENDFSGTKGKLLECFKSFDPVRVIAFQADSLHEVLEIKDRVRNIFNVGKHSIHITDSKEEAIRVARVVFNDNSIHFLNYAKPNKYISTHTKIASFKNFIKKNGLNTDDVVLDSGLVLSAYGLRESSDVDYFTDNNEKLIYQEEGVEYHDEELEYHDEKKSELIYNPKNHFYFHDLKFISFNQLYKMKRNRNEEKDRNDYKMMEALIKKNGFKIAIIKLRQALLYQKIKIRHNKCKLKRSFLEFLKKYRLYGAIRSLYRFLNKR